MARKMRFMSKDDEIKDILKRQFIFDKMDRDDIINRLESMKTD